MKQKKTDERIKIQRLFKKILEDEEGAKWEDIVSFLVSKKPENPDKKLEEHFIEFHEYLWSKEKDQKFYEERGLSGPRMYIPIKYQGFLNEMFKYENWWEIFMSNDFNFLQEPFCMKLIKQKI